MQLLKDRLLLFDENMLSNPGAPGKIDPYLKNQKIGVKKKAVG